MQADAPSDSALWPNAGAYQFAAQNVSQECSDVLLEQLTGCLPEKLRGVLYRNGPGRSECFGLPYGHPFDGDGMVLRFEFSRDGVRYSNRFVRTREFDEEEQAGRPLYRSFGTNLPGGLLRNFAKLRFKNAANTSVLRFRDSLLALWEGGLPHALDPRTLETLRREDFDGSLQNEHSALDRFLNPELPFSAHPKVCSRTGDIFNFGMALGATPRLYLYRLQTDGHFKKQSMPLQAMSFVHDFVLTDNYLVFIFPSVSFDIPRTLAGLSTPVDSIMTQDRPGELWVIDRHSFSLVRQLQVPSGFFFHFSNGYEAGEDIYLEGCLMPRFPQAADTRNLLEGGTDPFPKALLTRYRVTPSQVEVQDLAPIPAELPTIDERYANQEHGVTFFISNALENPTPFMNRIMRREMNGQVVEREFGSDIVGEPVFVPDSETAAEGSGWLLVMTHSFQRRRAELHVLSADSLESLTSFALPHTVPPGFHGFFEPFITPSSSQTAVS
ncbi:MAG: carotenoid oxygenase family protein [Polyangiaceae bacterium]|nr:carotenoid oxygenase family protein [Polyangiaceae bacterium]